MCDIPVERLILNQAAGARLQTESASESMNSISWTSVPPSQPFPSLAQIISQLSLNTSDPNICHSTSS